MAAQQCRAPLRRPDHDARLPRAPGRDWSRREAEVEEKEPRSTDRRILRCVTINARGKLMEGAEVVTRIDIQRGHVNRVGRHDDRTSPGIDEPIMRRGSRYPGLIFGGLLYLLELLLFHSSAAPQPHPDLPVQDRVTIT